MGKRLMQLKVSHPLLVRESEWDKLVEQYNALSYEDKKRIYELANQKRSKIMVRKEEFNKYHVYTKDDYVGGFVSSKEPASVKEKVYMLIAGACMGSGLISTLFLQGETVATFAAFFGLMGVSAVFAGGSFHEINKRFRTAPSKGPFANFVNKIYNGSLDKLSKIFSPSYFEKTDREEGGDGLKPVAEQNIEVLDQPSVAQIEEAVTCVDTVNNPNSNYVQ